MLFGLRWLVFLLLAASLARSQEPAANPNLPLAANEPRPQKWEFGIAVRAIAGACSGVIGTFPVPDEWPEQTVKLASEDVTPNVRQTFRTQDGLKQAVFQAGHVPAGGEAQCYLTFEIVKRPQKPPLDKAALVIPDEPPRDVKRYLNSSPLIESTNNKVRALARELTAGKETAWEQVEAIVAGVRERVKYEKESKSKFVGVLGALRDGQADREDITATFVALCRAAKIPARMVWAIDYGYAEFYLEESPPELPLEVAEKVKKPKQKSAPNGAWYPCVVHEPLELGVCTDERPILEKGDNFKVPEEKSVQRFVKEFLSVKGSVKPGVEFRRRNAD
jgi:transglutaminase-like putative cysteine protease